MTGALIILGVTVLTGLVLFLLHKPDEAAPESNAEESNAEESEECCGLHEVCEKKVKIMDSPEYYDDEELDRFAGRAATDYTPDETEEFRGILYTLLPEDVEAWGFSLQARGIEMPADLRSEWVMLAAEHEKDR